MSKTRLRVGSRRLLERGSVLAARPFPTQSLLLQNNTTGNIDGLVVARTIRIESDSQVNTTNSFGGLSGVPPVLYP